MHNPDAIEHSASAVNGAEMYVSIDVEKNSRSHNTRVKATVRWINWSSSTIHDFLVPLGDGVGGPGEYMELGTVLDGLMRRGEAAVSASVARTNAALVAKDEHGDK